MTSLVKKSWKIGQAVVDAAKTEYASLGGSSGQSTKPQQQAYYAPTQIPGQYTPSGPSPPLPPRPTNTSSNQQTNAPNGYQHGQAYGSEQWLYGHHQASYPPQSSTIGQGYVQDRRQWTGHIPGATPPVAEPGWHIPPPPPPPQPAFTTKPYTPHNQYTPATPLSAPVQPFPSQHIVQSPQLPPCTPISHPATSISPALLPSTQSSAVTSPFVYDMYQNDSNYSQVANSTAQVMPPSPPPLHTKPTVHAQMPNSATGFPPSHMEHPSTFLAELPAYEPHASDGPVGFIAELAAEDVSSTAAAFSHTSSVSGSSSPPVIPASTITPSSTVQQPQPVHPPSQQASGYMPYRTSSAGEPQHAPHPSVSPYQETGYAPIHSPGGPQHPPNTVPSPVQYTPYHPPFQFPISQYQYTNYNPQHTTPDLGSQSPVSAPPPPPARMSSLAQKVQQMNINNPLSQYAYSSTVPLDTKQSQNPEVRQRGLSMHSPPPPRPAS